MRQMHFAVRTLTQIGISFFQKSLRVVESPLDVVVKKGETAQFVARMSPCMPVPSVFWFYETNSPPMYDIGDRYQLIDGDKYKLETTQDGVALLTLFDAFPEDSGIYTMSASSSAGTVEVSAVLVVHGQCLCWHGVCMCIYTNTFDTLRCKCV